MAGTNAATIGISRMEHNATASAAAGKRGAGKNGTDEHQLLGNAHAAAVMNSVCPSGIPASKAKPQKPTKALIRISAGMKKVPRMPRTNHGHCWKKEPATMRLC